MAVNKKFRRIERAFRSGGAARVGKELKAYRLRMIERKKYRKFLTREKEEFDSFDFHALIDGLERKPLISIIVPVYNVDENWLRLCIDSVRNQRYTNWQMCIADDRSTAAHVRKVLEEYAAADNRIDVVFRETNGHISAASNSALKMATGEFCVLLDHDDELSADALFWLVKEMNDHPTAKMIFSDEDLIDENGRRYEPKFKPDFARDLFYSMNMITHLSAYDTKLLKDIGGFREGLEGSQDYDLALRVIEKIDENQIRHIPRILYHWRAIATSVASGGAAKPYAYEKARQALREHFDRTNIQAEVSTAVNDLNRVSYKVDSEVSISVISAGEGARSAETAAELNEAARTATGDILIFLDASLEPVSENWKNELASFAQRPEIGAVGGKIVTQHGAIEHSGYVLTEENIIANAHKGYLNDDPGYFFRAGLIGNYSAVSARCFAIGRELFLKIGGFDAENLSSRYFDADLCLRLMQLGFRIVYTPYAEFIETSAFPITEDDEQRIYFEKKWSEFLRHDPFYNQNLSQTEIFSIKI